MQRRRVFNARDGVQCGCVGGVFVEVGGCWWCESAIRFCMSISRGTMMCVFLRISTIVYIGPHIASPLTTIRLEIIVVFEMDAGANFLLWLSIFITRPSPHSYQFYISLSSCQVYIKRNQHNNTLK